MADDKTKRGPPDNHEVNVNEHYEVKAWATHWNVSRNDVLQARIDADSPWADRIEAVLERKGLLNAQSKRVRKHIAPVRK